MTHPPAGRFDAVATVCNDASTVAGPAASESVEPA